MKTRVCYVCTVPLVTHTTLYRHQSRPTRLDARTDIAPATRRRACNVTQQLRVAGSLGQLEVSLSLLACGRGPRTGVGDPSLDVISRQQLLQGVVLFTQRVVVLEAVHNVVALPADVHTGVKELLREALLQPPGGKQGGTAQRVNVGCGCH